MTPATNICQTHAFDWLDGLFVKSAAILKIGVCQVMGERVKWFLARDHKRCRKQSQIDEAVSWGAVARNIITLGTKRNEWSWQRALEEEGLIRAGDHLGFWHLWLLPLTGKGVSPSPGVQLRQIAEALAKKPVLVTELSTGRTLSNAAESIAMFDDARNYLAGRRGDRPSPGRPRIHDYTDDEWLIIAGMYNADPNLTRKQRIQVVRSHPSGRFDRFTYAEWHKKHGKQNDKETD